MRDMTPIGERMDRSRRQANDRITRLNVPISESGRVAFKKASNWGASISPEMAEAIAEAVREHAGLPADGSEKKPVFGYELRPI